MAINKGEMSRNEFIKGSLGGLLVLGFTAACSGASNGEVNALKTKVARLEGTATPIFDPTVQALQIENEQLREQLAQATATPAPTSTLSANPTEIPTQETISGTTEIANLPYFDISGAPDQIDHTKLRKWANETVPAPGDVKHHNEIGFGTEGFIAEPGVYTVNQLSEETESGWLLTGDRHLKLPVDPSTWPLNEEGFAMVTGAQMILNFNGIEVKLGRKEKHGWIAIVKSLPRDYKLDTDSNVPMKISNFDEGFVTATMLPPGQYVSQDYINQNADVVQGTYGKKRDPSGCGDDGCSNVSLACIDAATGAYSVVERKGVGAAWSLNKTNIK